MKIIGYGDWMLHITPFEYDRFFQTDTVRMAYAGAEGNVCTALGFWGERPTYITRLPQNAIAKKAVAALAACGVDTTHIAFGGSRMGVYFSEKGAGLRPSSVIYDRLPSSFTEASADDFDWDAVIRPGDWFFTTGITPSLTAHSAETCYRVLEEAKRRGAKIAYDVNFRSKLIDEAGAAAILRRIAPLLDCLIINEEHAKMLLNITSAYGEEDPENRLRDVIGQIRARFSIERIAVPVRRTYSANETAVFAAYDDGNDFALSRRYEIRIIDRVGSGDAFSAGLLRSILHGACAEDAVQWAVAANALKHTINGDTTYAEVSEIDAVCRNGRCDVQR